MMNRLSANAFLFLLRRELWESRKLFIASPAVLAALLVVASVVAFVQLPEEVLVDAAGQVAGLVEGVPVSQLALLLMPVAIPFMLVLYVCALVYLLGALYQDRKDGSILFWQSMPVSNLATVMSKVVTVCLVAPLFVVASVTALFLTLLLATVIVGASADAGIAVGGLLLASLYSLLLVYLTALLAALWLFPMIGWILLFSAFARNLPFLWAAGAFVLLILLESLIFGSQFLANWVESRSGNYDYVIFSAGDFFRRLFSYDMLSGILLGSLLVSGAVFMRRFTD